MTSFPLKEVEGCSRRLPPIQFGEMTLETLRTIYEKETHSPPHVSQKSQEMPPLAPQLRFSLTPKQPRKPPQLSRTVSPSLPTLSPSTSRYYVAVPSELCIDSRVGSRATYLSRNPFLRNMYPRSLLYRRFNTIKVNNEDNLPILEMQILGYPVDYWLSFPLKLPNRPECSKPFVLEPQLQNSDQEMAHAWATGPDLCSLVTLDRVVDPGPEPVDAMKFPWFSTTSSMKFGSLGNIISLGVEKITGYVKCSNSKCKTITGLSYLLPGRFNIVLIILEKKATELFTNSEEVLKQCDIRCLNCLKEVSPVISEDLGKINWLFLFLGCTLGYCTKNQLRYFCSKRKLKTSGCKNNLLYRVCENICGQLQPGISFPPHGFLERV